MNNNVQIHVLNSQDNYQNFFATSNQIAPIITNDENWKFDVGDFNNDGVPDVFAIHEGSGHSDIHILDGERNFQSYDLEVNIPISGTNYGYKIADYNRDGILDLYAIKKDGNSCTEVHILNGASNYSNFLLESGTKLEPSNDGNWDFGVKDYNFDGIPDLYCMKKNNGYGSSEVHILNGSNLYNNLFDSATPMEASDSYTQFVFGKGKLNFYAVKRNGNTNTEIHNFALQDERYDLLNRINNNAYGSVYTGTGQCKGFATKVFQESFPGTTIGSTASNNYSLSSFSNVTNVGCSLQGSPAAIKNIMLKARTGDFIQMCWNSYTPHSAIFVSFDYNGFTFFSANMNGNNGITKTYMTYNDYAYRISKSGEGFTLYTAKQY